MSDIKPTQEEVWANNILNGQVTNAQAELQRIVAARDAFIRLLEDKYNAVLDGKTGTLKEKKCQPTTTK